MNQSGKLFLLFIYLFLFFPYKYLDNSLDVYFTYLSTVCTENIFVAIFYAVVNKIRKLYEPIRQIIFILLLLIIFFYKCLDSSL